MDSRAPGPAGPPDGWNTWDAGWPASIVHLGSGAVLRVGAYSAGATSSTGFPWSASYRLGRHDIGGGEIAADLTHAGSTVRLEAAAAGEGAVAGQLTCTDTAEWGLRFWLLLEFGADGDPATRLVVPPGGAYLEPPVAVLDAAGMAAAFSTAGRPADARLTLERHVLGKFMESHGYSARPAAPERGRFAVFRFTAAGPAVRFAAAVAPDAGTAQDRVWQVLAAEDPERAAGRSARPSVRGSGSGGNSAAIRGALGWNSVWDPVNRQVYTASTRAWIARKFGGFGVWQIDGFLHAVLAAHVGAGRLAWDNVAAVLAGRAADGNLAALRAATTDWADRSHPPVGDGHFVHTRQAAVGESGNDNSPVHDDARFDLATHTLDLEDVGLNSLLVHEGSLLARLTERRCYENFSQRTGGGGDSVDAEPFYTWGTLLPLIADLEVIGTDPWTAPASAARETTAGPPSATWPGAVVTLDGAASPRPIRLEIRR